MKLSIFCLLFFLIACEDNSSSEKKNEPDPVEPPPIVDVSEYDYKWEHYPTIPPRVEQMSKNDDIYFVNENVGWAMASSYGEIYKTTDGGNTWMLQLDTTAYFRAMGFLDENVGFVGNLRGAEYGGTMYMTQNGGASWAKVAELDSPFMDGVCGISIVDENTVYASGRYTGRAIVAKSTNRGANWELINLEPDMDMIVDVYFWTPNKGLVVGGVGRDGSSLKPARTVIMKTEDGGQTWTKTYTTTREAEWGWKINFLEGNERGFVSIQSFRGYLAGTTHNTEYFLKTTDGGNSWTEHAFSAPNGELYSSQAIGFVNDTVGWMGSWRSSQPALKTTDGGLTWQTDFTEGTFNRIRFTSDSTGYATGNYLYKLKRTKKD